MPMSAARLRENLAANNVAATVLEVALGAEDGTAEMAPMESGETANAAFVERATGSSTTVKVMRLDEIAVELALHRCDVVKVDVEGGELAVLRGGATFLERHQPLIYLELNDPRMEAMGWKESELLELARSWGYEVFVETAGGFERFRRTGPMDNILLVRK
jgi:FkbM family methyltransferase